MAGCAVAVLVTALAAYRLNYRLFRTTETALAALRVRAFRHVHDLSMLHQQAARRGSLVSRVTSDVDQMSVFMQWGGILVVTSAGQLLLATVLMAVYSWQLTLLVYACFLPLAIALPKLQKRLAARVRRRSGSGSATCSARSPSRWSAPRPSGRTRWRTGPRQRIDAAIDRHYRSAVRAQKTTVLVFTTGELVAGAGQRGRGRGRRAARRRRARADRRQAGRVPVPGHAVHRAGAGGLGGADRGAERAGLLPPGARRGRRRAGRGRPGRRAGGTALPPGPLGVRFDSVMFRYPQANRAALVDVDLEIRPRTRVAVVGETGSGKTTFAKLLTRLMDPTSGRVLVGGVPLTEVPFGSLRSRVVMVPQDGFLFDESVADNVRYGRPGRDRRGDRRRVRARSGWATGWPGCRTGVRDPGRAARRGAVGGGAAAGRDRPGVRRPTRTCWCWTRRPPRSTRPPRCG